MSKRRLKRHQNFPFSIFTRFSAFDALVPSAFGIFENVDEIERLFGTLTKILDFYYLFHLFFRNKHCFVTLKDALHLLEKMQPQLSRFLSYVDNFQYLAMRMRELLMTYSTSYHAEIPHIVRTCTVVVVEVLGILWL